MSTNGASAEIGPVEATTSSVLVCGISTTATQSNLTDSQKYRLTDCLQNRKRGGYISSSPGVANPSISTLPSLTCTRFPLLATPTTSAEVLGVVFRVFDLKGTLMSMADVPPERQKILGLVKGKLPDDNARM